MEAAWGRLLGDLALIGLPIFAKRAPPKYVDKGLKKNLTDLIKEQQQSRPERGRSRSMGRKRDQPGRGQKGSGNRLPLEPLGESGRLNKRFADMGEGLKEIRKGGPSEPFSPEFAAEMAGPKRITGSEAAFSPADVPAGEIVGPLDPYSPQLAGGIRQLRQRPALPAGGQDFDIVGQPYGPPPPTIAGLRGQPPEVPGQPPAPKPVTPPAGGGVPSVISNLRMGAKIQMGYPSGSAHFEFEGQTWEAPLPMGGGSPIGSKYGDQWAMDQIRAGKARPLGGAKAPEGPRTDDLTQGQGNVPPQGVAPGQPPSAGPGSSIFTPEQIADFKKYGIDVSKVPEQYKAEALQQLDFAKRQEEKLSSPDYNDQVRAEMARQEAARGVPPAGKVKPGKKPKPKKEPANLIHWIKTKGGIWDKSLPGEMKQLGTKEGRTVGLLRKKTGRPLDELALLAVEDGWLPPGSTSTEFLALVTGDIQGKKAKRFGAAIEDDTDLINQFYEEIIPEEVVWDQPAPSMTQPPASGATGGTAARPATSPQAGSGKPPTAPGQPPVPFERQRRYGMEPRFYAKKEKYRDPRGEDGPFHDVWRIYDNRTKQKASGVDYSSEERAAAVVKRMNKGKSLELKEPRWEFGGRIPFGAVEVVQPGDIKRQKADKTAQASLFGPEPPKEEAPKPKKKVEVEQMGMFDQPKAEPEKAQGKQPWEIRKDEFVKSYPRTDKIHTDQFIAGYHRGQVEGAVKKGLSVPKEVLAEYPDLVRKESFPEPPKKETAEIPEDPKWAVPGSGRPVKGEMVWENRFAKGKFGTEDGPMEDTPEKAVEALGQKKRQGEENARLGDRIAAAIKQVKTGNYTDETIKILTGRGLLDSTSGTEGILRSLGLTSKEARKVVRNIPDVATTRNGAILFKVRDAIEYASRKGYIRQDVPKPRPEFGSRGDGMNAAGVTQPSVIEKAIEKKAEQAPEVKVEETVLGKDSFGISIHIDGKLAAEGTYSIYPDGTAKIGMIRAIKGRDTISRSEWLQAQDQIKELHPQIKRFDGDRVTRAEVEKKEAPKEAPKETHGLKTAKREDLEKNLESEFGPADDPKMMEIAQTALKNYKRIHGPDRPFELVIDERGYVWLREVKGDFGQLTLFEPTKEFQRGIIPVLPGLKKGASEQSAQVLGEKLAAAVNKPAKEFKNLPDKEAMVTFGDIHKWEAENYFKDHVKISSSREIPMPPYPWKEGTWSIDDGYDLAYGHSVEKLVRLPVKDLILTEEDYTKVNYGGRGDDARRYAGWIKEGKEPPPISVVETDSGTMNVSNGHRRVAAAKLAGKDTILAWVSPRMEVMKGPNGPIYVGMTYEGATLGPKEAEKQREARRDADALKAEAKRLGVTYKGPWMDKGKVVLENFTDNLTHGDFAIKPGGDIKEALLKMRKPFVEKGNIPASALNLAEPKKTFGADKLDLSKFQLSTGPVWFSKMAEVLGSKLPNSGTPEGMFNAVKAYAAKGEFKPAELKWSGLEDWLFDKAAFPKGKVTKAEVLEFLKANQVEVAEVEKARQPLTIPEQLRYGHFLNRSHVPWSEADHVEYNALRDKAVSGQTKFEQYTLPGGKNYRELLLKLPKSEPRKNSFEEWNEVRKSWDNPPGTMEEYKKGVPVNLFRSSHFSDDLNVMAHVRFDDRTNAQGERVLFLEEIQSDWALEGRKKGWKEAPVIYKEGEYYRIKGWELKFFSEADARARYAQATESQGPPSFPFAKNWEELVLKRMLRYAAENGYNRLAWINGEETAKRYDLSKQAKRVYWNASKAELIVTGLDGKDLLTERGVYEGKLPDYLGKSVAEKLINEPSWKEGGDQNIHVLSGPDLRINAPWAINLYDKMIPEFLKKYGKKWGAKVEESPKFKSPVTVGGEPTQAILPYKFQSIPITPPMRGEVMTKGQALFERRKKYEADAPAKNLAIVHNLSADNLRHALKLGGLAVPSTAVIDVEKSTYDNFGDITLIAHPNRLGPEAGKENKYFDADIYSPRYPRAKYRLTPKSEKALVDWLKPIEEAIPPGPAGPRFEGKHFPGAYVIESRVTDMGLSSALKIDNPLMEYAYLQEAGKLPKGVTNSYEGRGKLVEENIDRKDFEKWVDDKIKTLGLEEEGRIWSGTDRNGNSRWRAETLDLVVRILKRELQGGEGFNYGVPSVRAKVAKRFRTVKQIQADRDRIISKKDMDQVKDEIDQEFVDLAGAATDLLKYKRGFGDLDVFSEHLIEAIETHGFWKIFGDKSEYYEPGVDVQGLIDFVGKLRKLPTGYFEGKIQRAVGLHEFDRAVVPHDTPAELIDQLKTRGLEVETYKRGDQEARKAAVKKSATAGGVLFEPRKEYGAENIDWERVKELGKTDSLKEAGFISPDGSLIDLSGKREGGTPGRRVLDHREVGGSLGMQELMAAGYVRMDYRSGAIDIFSEPTPKQYEKLRDIIDARGGEIALDLWDGLGEKSGTHYYLKPEKTFSSEYPKNTRAAKVIGEIKGFFSEHENIRVELKQRGNQYSWLYPEDLKLATEALVDLRKVEKLPVKGREGAGIKTLGNALSTELIKKGYVDFEGREVKGLDEFVGLAQVWRNPKYETNRWLLLKKMPGGGFKVLGHYGTTSKVPGSTMMIKGAKEKYRQELQKLRDRIRRVGSDLVYSLHNHPSALVRPSQEDGLVNEWFGSNNPDGTPVLPEYAGSIIINHEKYALLLKSIGREIHRAKVVDIGTGKDDPLHKPSIDHPEIGTTLSSPKDVAALFKRMQLSKDRSVLLFLDATMRINGIMDVHNSELRSKQAVGFLRNRGREFGSLKPVIVSEDFKLQATLLGLYEKGYIHDGAIIKQGGIHSLRNIVEPGQEPAGTWLGKSTAGIRVSESAGTFAADPRHIELNDKLEAMKKDLSGLQREKENLESKVRRLDKHIDDLKTMQARRINAELLRRAKIQLADRTRKIADLADKMNTLRRQVEQTPTGSNTIVKRRRLGEKKEERFAPPVTAKQLDAIKRIAEKAPMKGVMRNWFETAPRMFDYYGKDAKEMFYRPAVAARHEAHKEILQVFKEIDQKFKKLPRNSPKRVGIYAIAQQKNGLNLLKEAGIKEVPKLSPEEMSLYGWAREKLMDTYWRLQAARKVSGEKPFPPTGDYFSFMRNMNFWDRMGLRPMNASLEMLPEIPIHLRTTAFRFAKRRTGGTYPVAVDAKFIMKTYMKSALTHIHIGPVVSQMREYLGTYEMEPKAGGTWIMKDVSPLAYHHITSWVDHISGMQPVTNMPEIVQRIIKHLSRNIVASTLAFSIRSALIQPTSLLQTWVRLGTIPMLKAVPAMLHPSEWRRALAQSHHLSPRIMDIALDRAIDEIWGPVAKANAKLDFVGFWLLRTLDYTAANFTWLAAEQAGKRLGITGPELNDFADDITIATQGSGAREDVSAIQRTILGHAMTLFQTFNINQWGALLRDTAGIGMTEKMPKREIFRRLLYFLVGVTVINTVYEDMLGMPSPLPTPINSYLKAKEEGKTTSEALLQSMYSLAGIHPLLGGMRFGSTPLGALADWGMKGFQKLAQWGGGMKGQYVPPATEIAARGLGVRGTSQIYKTARGLNKGQSLPRALVGTTKSSTPGKAPVNRPLPGPITKFLGIRSAKKPRGSAQIGKEMIGNLLSDQPIVPKRTASMVPPGMGELNYLQSLLASIANQELNTTASPTFVGLTLSGLTASLPIVTNASKALASVAYATFKASLAIAQADVAGLTTASSPTFAGMTLTAFSGYVKATAGVLSAGAIAAGDLPAHVLDGAVHSVSGLTGGHFLKATGATTFAFGAHGLTYSDVGAEASGAVSSHAALITGVHGLVFTAGKALTLQKSMTLTAADDTGSYTFPTGTKTLLATDGSPAAMVIASQATGDMLYASSATAWARLPIGAANKALVVNAGGTLPEWGTVLTNPMDARRTTDLRRSRGRTDETRRRSHHDDPGRRRGRRTGLDHGDGDRGTCEGRKSDNFNHSQRIKCV